jgi:hypothetical protein
MKAQSVGGGWSGVGTGIRFGSTVLCMVAIHATSLLKMIKKNKNAQECEIA